MPFIHLITEVFAMLRYDVMLLIAASVSGGIIIGALPGLTATMGIALLSSLTFGMDRSLAIPILIGIYVGAIFGGSVSAILLNIPGTGASAATALDGFPLAARGDAKLALITTRMASMLGTLVGVICLISFAPLISQVAETMFASPEFFLLGVFGLVLCGSLTSGGEPLKGWVAAVLGLLISAVGIEGIYGYQRFVYTSNLLSGVSFIPAMIGIFSIPQVISMLCNSSKSEVRKVERKRSDIRGMFRILGKNKVNILRSGLLGVCIGSIPGVGEDIASWISYDRAKRASKEPEKFGSGSYEGIIASETANNSCIGGSIIPLLTLAVPGSPPAAVLLGAMYLHGIRPGPMLSFEFPNFIYEITAMLFWATIALFIFGTLLSSLMVRILKVRPIFLMPIVAALSVMGAYAIGLSIFDVYVMLAFGLLGIIFYKLNIPAAPLILGAILGPLVDTNFRRSLLASDGDLSVFITRPISVVFVVLIIWSIVSQPQYVRQWINKIFWRKK